VSSLGPSKPSGGSLVRIRPQHGRFVVVRSATAHLQLAIDVDSDPISGSVSNGDELTEPLMGWIELTAAIEAARSTSHGGEASPAEVGVDGKTLGSHPGANGGHA
jgi:hypothetical protein